MKKLFSGQSTVNTTVLPDLKMRAGLLEQTDLERDAGLASGKEPDEIVVGLLQQHGSNILEEMLVMRRHGHGDVVRQRQHRREAAAGAQMRQQTREVETRGHQRGLGLVGGGGQEDEEDDEEDDGEEQVEEQHEEETTMPRETEGVVVVEIGAIHVVGTGVIVDVAF